MLKESEHKSFKENVAAYALGALDPWETAGLETHLKTCAPCRRDLRAYRQVSEKLLMTLPPQAPSAALRNRLQHRLPSAQKIGPRTWAWSSSQLALGFAVLALVAVNLYSIFRIQYFAQQQSQLAHEIQTSQIALAMLAYPGTQSLPINSANITGTLLLDKDRNVAVLFIWDLPQLQSNEIYQAWFIDRQGERTSAATFSPEPNLPFTSVPLISTAELSAFVGLGVTIEPAGGSKQPTGPRVLKIDY